LTTNYIEVKVSLLPHVNLENEGWS
jgi:hypothetical protein